MQCYVRDTSLDYPQKDLSERTLRISVAYVLSYRNKAIIPTKITIFEQNKIILKQVNECFMSVYIFKAFY